MKRLPPLVRAKAIEIANAMLAEGHDEGLAIRVAVAKAKARALRQGAPLARPATADPLRIVRAARVEPSDSGRAACEPRRATGC